MLNMLNELQIRNAKPKVRLAKGSRGADIDLPDNKPAPRLTKLSDGGGLLLWIEPTGAKRWRMAYRFAGKQKSLAFGSYPATSLAEARAARDAARKLLAAGIDPSQHKRATRAAQAVAQASTFGIVGGELLDKKRREGKAAKTLKKLEWLLTDLAAPLAQRPVAEISAAEILTVLQAVESRGRHETARRLRSTIGEVFRRAASTGRAQGDPTTVLRGALTTPRVQHRPAIIEPKAFGELLRAIDGYQGAPETRLALQLLSLTFVRPGELRTAEWSEFDLDAEQPTWIIPAAKMKMRREHKVPLAPPAVVIIRELRTLSRGGKYVFPGGRTITRPMSENAMNAALRRMGYAKGEHTSHGFKASASSMLNESKLFHGDAIERALAHVEGNAVRKAYARADFWEERIQLMQWWADRCEEMRANAGVARAA
jgi:integrase